jgi:predicted lipoprotein
MTPQGTIPVQPVPSQTLNVTLSGQAVTLNIQSRSGVLYMDVISNGAAVLYGVACRNNSFVVINSYFGFIGDFQFQDTQGTDDPVYGGLGGRYVLVYFA